jgi:probable rRNA maturation factor
MNNVEVNTANIEVPDWTGRLEEFARRILDEKNQDNWDLSILLCDDAFIRELNASFRGKDEPTDILSFSQDGYPWEETARGGDIVISLPTVRRYADEFGVTEEEELKRVTIHGILHLQGREHETNEQNEPMLKEQERLVQFYTGVKVF